MYLDLAHIRDERDLRRAWQEVIFYLPFYLEMGAPADNAAGIASPLPPGRPPGLELPSGLLHPPLLLAPRGPLQSHLPSRHGAQHRGGDDRGGRTGTPTDIHSRVLCWLSVSPSFCISASPISCLILFRSLRITPLRLLPLRALRRACAALRLLDWETSSLSGTRCLSLSLSLSSTCNSVSLHGY